MTTPMFIELINASYPERRLVGVSNIVWAREHSTQSDWTEILFVGKDHPDTFAIHYDDLKERLLGIDK